jgi:hypothetical protein
VVRVRCIDRPQFGHGGRTIVRSPTGRCNFCNANMVPSRGYISNERMKFKRTFETQAGRKQGIFVI